MKKLIPILAIVVMLGITIPLAAQNPQPLTPDVSILRNEPGKIIDETSHLWFVELPSPPAVEGTSLRQLNKEHRAFRAEAAKAGLQYTERFAFSNLWNGLSIAIDPAQVGLLTQLRAVAGVYPVLKVDAPEPMSGEVPDLFTSLGMIGADVVHSELGFTGEGIKVAVMDTGIDYDHPDLGGCFGEGCRVAYGYDFVGDDFTGDNDPVPDDDPDDCNGHGTHVSGIVGANGEVVGVAPDATFGAYRVFGCEGHTWADIMIAAMEMILADDMDVLNMSIGSAFFGWPQYPTAAASDRLVNQGIVVVASAGNSGTSGTYAVGSPGAGKKTIGVASYDNLSSFLPYFTVADDDTKVSYILMEYAAEMPTSGTEEMVFVGQGCDDDEYLVDPDGKVALIVRGACSFREKALKAQAAGATAAIIHNSSPGNFNGTLGSPAVDFPVASISQEDGEFIRTREPVDITWTDQMDLFPHPNAGLLSDFSSYGPAADLSLKPDIGAPGGSIYSTLPLEQGGYGVKGGTSMAAPHVSGAVALLLEAHPNTPSQAVRRILQNSADPAVWSLNPGLGALDHTFRQGAGMLDIDDAILATTRIEPGKLSLGESEAGPYHTTLYIENKGMYDVTYDLSYESAVATTGTWADDLDFWLTDEVVDFGMDSVTVPAGGSKNVSVTIYPPTGPDQGLYGGYIIFTPQDEGQVYRIPYAGFVGDYQSLPVLDANPYDLPWLLDSAGGDYTFTMEAGDYPTFWVNLGQQVRKLRMAVTDADTGRSWHLAFDEAYYGRNSNYSYFFEFVWDGWTSAGRKVRMVPDGDYVVELQIQKALGEDNNPDHWETWTSPVITIDRP
jgi:subtilisin family serine protease